jgi:DNA repair protein RecN (Recombination protein N)
MLDEIRIVDLGVVEDETLVFDAGMIAFTGETGAGKTMITEAIRLLCGGRVDPHVVRTGANEAVVEARFRVEGEDRIIKRVIAAKGGKSRAYIDGSMASVSALTEATEGLVDIHGQNTHHSLAHAGAQRHALDSFGNIDVDKLVAARSVVREFETELERLSGDESARIREIDLLKFQLNELDDAQIDDPGELESLTSEESALANVEANRQTLASIRQALGGDGAAVERLSMAKSAAQGKEITQEVAKRLDSVAVELADILLDVEREESVVVEDPQRLSDVQSRRFVLRQIERKYGPTLADAILYRDQTRQRLSELESYDETLEKIQQSLDDARKKLAKVEAETRKQRIKVAPVLEKEVQVRLRQLALPNAVFEVHVGEDNGGDNVVFHLGPNPGMAPLPLAKAASGGELSRSMLALQLALLDAGSNDSAPGTLIFDEVDAGIGGEAALSVGASLAELATSMAAQVFVVTHLAQVAAFADHQIVVSKSSAAGKTATSAKAVSDQEREIELTRMLSGKPDSKSGRMHAKELLEQAKRPKTRTRAKNR